MDDKTVDLNTQIKLTKRAQVNYHLGGDNLFQITSVPPVPTDQVPQGSIVVRIHIIGITSQMRNWVIGDPNQHNSVMIDSPMNSRAIGQVIYSKGKIKIGTMVLGLLGWQKYAVVSQKNVIPLTATIPPQLFLNVIGSSGLTAYIGLIKIAKVSKGETVVISVIGADGQIAIELAKNEGCKTIAVVDSDHNTHYLKKLGASQVINFKKCQLQTQLKKIAPKGIDVYLDFVGGQVLDSVLMNIKDKSRIILGGYISSFNQKQPYKLKNYPRLIIKKCMLQGFKYFDYLKELPEIIQTLLTLLQNNKITSNIQWFQGIDQCPNAFKSLLSGSTRGSVIVKIHNNPIQHSKL